MNQVFEDSYVLFELLEIGVLFDFIHRCELFDFEFVEFTPEFLYSFAEHVAILLEVFLTVLDLLDAGVGLFQFSGEGSRFVLEFRDVAVLFLAGVVFVEVQTIRYLFDELVLFVEFF